MGHSVILIFDTSLRGKIYVFENSILIKFDFLCNNWVSFLSWVIKWDIFPPLYAWVYSIAFYLTSQFHPTNLHNLKRTMHESNFVWELQLISFRANISRILCYKFILSSLTRPPVYIRLELGWLLYIKSNFAHSFIYMRPKLRQQLLIWVEALWKNLHVRSKLNKKLIPSWCHQPSFTRHLNHIYMLKFL